MLRNRRDNNVPVLNRILHILAKIPGKDEVVALCGGDLCRGTNAGAGARIWVWKSDATMLGHAANIADAGANNPWLLNSPVVSKIVQTTRKLHASKRTCDLLCPRAESNAGWGSGGDSPSPIRTSRPRVDDSCGQRTQSGKARISRRIHTR